MGTHESVTNKLKSVTMPIFIIKLFRKRFESESGGGYTLNNWTVFTPTKEFRAFLKHASNVLELKKKELGL